RPKIERLVLEAPVLGAKLRAPVLVHHRAVPQSLFEPQPKAERALPRLVAELVSDLGQDAVSSLALGDSLIDENRSLYRPFGSTKKKEKTRRHLLSSVPEPTRLLAEPRSVPRESVRVTRHLSRLESLEWWREPPKSSPQAASQTSSRVDYVQA